jgi:hypothetical protein
MSSHNKSSNKKGASSTPATTATTAASAQTATTAKDGTPRPPIARGHKQRGAGTVIVAKAPVVTNDGIVLKVSDFNMQSNNTIQSNYII